MGSVRDHLGEQGISLRHYAAGDHRALCPKCSHQRRKKTDQCLSVKIDSEGATWRCHHCAWSGGARDHREEFRPQQRRAPVKPTYTLAPKLPLSFVDWFAGRCIPAAVLERNRIGAEQVWMPGCADGEKVQAITFPYILNGEVVNIKYRTEDKQFRQVKDAAKTYYGTDDIAGASEIIVCEGEIDKLSFEVAGLRNAVSVPDGAPKQVKAEVPADPDEDLKYSYVWNCREAFESVTKIILATDGDGPGEALAEELARRYGKHRCWRVTWPTLGDVTCKDANEVLVQHGAQVLREVIEHARPYPIKSLHDADVFETEYLRLFRGESVPAFSTGWSEIDPRYKVRPGELTVVTGFPGAGKSQWIDALTVNLAEAHGWQFAVCSFENPAPRHLANLAEIYMRAPFWEGPTPRMSEADARRARAWLRDRFFFIRTDDESPTIDWILDTAREAVMRHGIKGLVIDPYNEIEHKRPSNMTEPEYVSQLLGKVKRFAQTHGVHVWFVAHPAKPYRNDKGQIPKLTLYDISGAAHWSNKADAGIVVDRDWDTGETTIRVKKVRFKEIGSVGDVTLKYDKATGRYAAPEPRQFRTAYPD